MDSLASLNVTAFSNASIIASCLASAIPSFFTPLASFFATKACFALGTA